MRRVISEYLTRFGEVRESLAPSLSNKWATTPYDKNAKYLIEYKLFMHNEIVLGKFVGATDESKSLMFEDLSRPRDFCHDNNTRHIVMAIPTENIISIAIAK